MEVAAMPDPDEPEQTNDEPDESADEPQPVRIKAKPAVVFPQGA